jgi:transcriptional regulator with GAF, ATPase, and Fis domain
VFESRIGNDARRSDVRVEFETLIADVSAALIATTPADVDAVVETALERLRAFFAVDRTGLLRVSDDRTLVTVTHAAYAPGIRHVPPLFEVAQLFPWSYEELVVNGRPVVIPRMNDLPPEAARDRETFRQLGAVSNLTVPIASAGVVTHLMTLASLTAEQAWPSEYLPRVRLLGETIVGAVIRARTLRELQSANEELHRLRERTEEENVYLRQEIRATGTFIAGRSEAMRKALGLAAQVARTGTTVLITGETGTGKERVATFIHDESDRHARHAVRVNCSAIPTALIESELFGREKGAYTGALTRQIGRFELAHGSTLFLDEIGDLPPEVQVKLLRVLQERTVERLGNPAPIPVDVRIIAATNRDLEAAVRAGSFRADLYYRLNVFPIAVPALRERREDLPALVEALVAELSPAVRRRFTSIDRASLKALGRYDWPGNIRELRNVLERAMILSPEPTLKVDVPVASGAAADRRDTVALAPPPMPGGLQEWEREQVLRVLRDTGWRIRGPRGAAAVLNLKPTTLEKRMARLGIRRPSA